MRLSRRSMGCFGAAVAAAVLGFAAYWVLTGRTTDNYSDDVGYVLVSADGRTVSATAPGQLTGDCTDNVSRSLAVGETAHTVRLQVHTRIEHGFGVGVCGPGSAPMARVLSVRLASPLWGRALVDGAGRSVPYFDGRTLLTVDPVPVGFHLVEVRPGSWTDPSTGKPAPTAVQDYESGSGWLLISQQTGTAWSPPGGARSTVAVGGHTAYEYAEGETVLVTWVQKGQIIQVTYADGTRPDAATIAAALRIARSLR